MNKQNEEIIDTDYSPIDERATFFLDAPSWGLPSTSPSCLAVWNYLKLASIDHDVSECHNPNVSPTTRLPMLQTRDRRLVCGLDAILEELGARSKDLNAHLSESQRRHALMLTALLDRLERVWYFHANAVPVNYELVTRRRESENYPFPLSALVPRRVRNRELERLRLDGWYDKTRCYESARHIFEALSAELADKPYFFNNKPSAIDAIVLGHLVALSAAPFPDTTLYDLFAAHDNLQRYTRAFIDEFISEPIRMVPLQVPRNRIFASWRGPVDDDDYYVDQHGKRVSMAEYTEYSNRHLTTLLGFVGIATVYLVVTRYIGADEIEVSG